MVYLNNLFSPQHHKTNSGYYINHDTLMAVNPQDRRKLIFYFIAQQTPEKLTAQDKKSYSLDRRYRLDLPISVWTFAGLLTPAILSGLSNPLFLRKNPLVGFTGLLFACGTGGMIGNTLGWRVFEGRMLEGSDLINQLSQKYKFGIYDFTVAKKQSHIKKLLLTMGCHHDTLHQVHDA